MSAMDQLRSLVCSFLSEQPVNVYLFGSRARGDARQTSDVDIAVEIVGETDSGLLSKLRLELEESSVPYKVDLVDLNTASDGLITKVKEEGVLWKGYNKD